EVFSAGGDLDLVAGMADDFEVRARVLREARDLVYNLLNCSKPVVSAMAGPAVGAGLVIGLLADISIAAPSARIIDGHPRLGGAGAVPRPSARHLDRGPPGPDHRRPPPPGGARRRPRGHRLAAAVRHGQGQVPPAAVRAGV